MDGYESDEEELILLHGMDIVYQAYIVAADTTRFRIRVKQSR